MSESTRQDGVTIVKLDQDFTAAEAEEIKKELLGVINGLEGEMTIDFLKVKKVDSIGLGILVAAQNSLGKLGKELTVINASKNICHLFAMTHLNRFFTVSSCNE